MFSCFGGSQRSEDPSGGDAPVKYPHQEKPIANADAIPIRLSMRERKGLRLMRGIVMATRYTDKVDRESLPEAKRNGLMAKEVANALQGFVYGVDKAMGADLMTERDFSPHKKFISFSVEACRRYKIMNPDLMRTDYVKFLYMLQDAASPVCQEALGFDITSPILTVKKYCEAFQISELLADDRLPICITPVPKIKDRNALNKALRYKDTLVSRVCKEYAKQGNCKPDDVELAIRSLNDASCFDNDNVDACTDMLVLLQRHFSVDEPSSRKLNLSITEGKDGSRLTHEHAMQFTFVLQSLALWKNISNDMFKLWMVAEQDMLNPEHPYEFRSTGQGYHRVQQAPRLYVAISEVLEKTKTELGQWVGSEKIHLGDNQVPNAFHFIDKYGQISRILIPILRVVDHIDVVSQKDPKVEEYLREVWGSADDAKIAVLSDFFRSGFDGSGGDNMEDAGSCIDGRLTSAWNWCNNIRTKPFYPLFLMAGFTSFDGDLTL